VNPRNDYQRGASPGDCLRQLRVDKALDIDTLAQRTCVNEQIIECLENDDWLALPAMVYVRGYVRILCRELDGDERDILRRLEAQTVTLHQPIPMAPPSGRGWHVNPSTLAAAVVVATLLIGLLTNFITSPLSGSEAEADARTGERGVVEEQENQR
jgi:cytoskeleton protein RodZ